MGNKINNINKDEIKTDQIMEKCCESCNINVTNPIHIKTRKYLKLENITN